MNDRQENKLSMYYGVQKVLTDHQAKWTPLVAYAQGVSRFNSYVQDIKSHHQVQQTSTTGTAEDKSAVRTACEAKAIVVAKAVYAYASDGSNNSLKQRVNYSASDLRNARDTVSRDICQVIYEEADKVLANLSNYGIVQADLNDLQQKIDDYAALIPAPKLAKDAGAIATTNLDLLFKQADDVLSEVLDQLMAKFNITEPEFYQAYFRSRKVVKTGSRKKGKDDDEDQNDDGTHDTSIQPPGPQPVPGS